MASGSSLVSEEQLLCPICLDVFTRPVSTPCGHNFCMSCISSYWDTIPVSQCPACKETFERRPDLKVNTFISQLASQIKSLQVTDTEPWSPNQQPTRCGEAVLCDVCTDAQREAVKSCLECLTSYCDVHLEPHHRAAGLKRHTLVEPLVGLEDRICKDHTRLLTLFCRDHQVLLCDVCAGLHHVKHYVVPVQQAGKEVKVWLRRTEAEVQQMIQERLQKVRDMKESVGQSNPATKDLIEIESSVQELTALVSEIQKSQTELVKELRKKLKAEEEQIAVFIVDMEREVIELQNTTTKVRELKETADPLHLLKSFSNQSVLPQTMDLTTVSFQSQVATKHTRKYLSKSLSQLRVLLKEVNTEIRNFSAGTDVPNDGSLKYVQQYEVDVVLDPDTAHPRLIVSRDRKQVRFEMGLGWPNYDLNPSRFVEHIAVLGDSGFLSQKFYFEVFVGGKIEWCLGVATASVKRSEAPVPGPHCGLWVIYFLKNRFGTFSSPNVSVHFGKVEQVGVFVDYEGGKVSFYDVQTATLIYSFTECVFTEELLPYLNPCDHEYGANFGPMIIVPVGRTQ